MTESRAGRVLLLNGPSSAGKSTLARAVQQALPTPFLHLTPDHLFGQVLGPETPRGWWKLVRRRFFLGFTRSLRAYAEAGNDVVVDFITETEQVRAELADALRGLDVFLVGVHCDLAELERRERARGDRRVGDGRADVEVLGVHRMGGYDFEVDTTPGVTSKLAAQVVAAWVGRSGPSALFSRSS